MRFISIFLTILFFPLISICQCPLSFAELEKLQSAPIMYVDQYLKSRGFSFHGGSQGREHSEKHYFCMVDDNRSGAWQLSILVIPGGLLVITYETTDHKEQEKVIKALAAKGFKERKASTVTMVETQLGPTRKFSNGKKEVQLFAYSMDNAVYYTLNIGPANIK